MIRQFTPPHPRHPLRSVAAGAALACSLTLLGGFPVSDAIAQETPAARAAADRPAWLAPAVEALEMELVAAHGEAQRDRARRGLDQVAEFWRVEDGDRAAFESFVRANFAGDAGTLDAMFERFEERLEALDGHMNEIVVAFRLHSDLDRGPILPFDETFAGYDPSAHVSDDFFANRLAFTVLLNFPLTTLEQRLEEGDGWSRRQWAEARLAQRFDRRVPAAVQLAAAQAGARADRYIAEYNIWTHHVIDPGGGRLFPPGQRLLAHWNLRDEIKAQYADPEDGLARQRLLRRVMERIVDQTIPAAVIDNPHVDWDPVANTVVPAEATDADAPPPDDLDVSAAREPDTRYAVWLETFRAARLVDPWSPTAPTHIARRFEEDREIPEARVEAMFERVLESPLLARTGRLIESRLGRPLEAHDIWYAGFRPRGAYTEAELDQLVAERFADAAAYERAMPDLLVDLGFEPERSAWIADRIVVQPARGSGHAWGAGMRGAPSRLRTRVGAEGMDYKGFNIAVHEMGHNVEQTLSLYGMDHYLLQGVPNTAFTEAMAFVFQDRDLELLGLAAPDARSRALQALDDYWGTAEIASVALVDMRAWHWLYDHPEATPAEFRDAVLEIARGVWNRYWAPVIGERDVTLFAIYSHLVHSWLYTPDYPIGHMIAAQVKQQVEAAGDLGAEFERMVRTGNVTPDLWMETATGRRVGPDALLARAEDALRVLEAEPTR